MERSFSSVVIIAVIVGGLYLVIKLMRFSVRSECGVSSESFKPKYRYAARKYIMTQAESEFFRRLERIAGDRYYVFPQIHLSSLLNHAAYRQNRRAALAVIQRKSVDFVLVDKATLETRYAVELDDSTHDMPDRQLRDGKVEAYLSSVRIPLVRLRNVESMTDDEISAEFEKVHEG